MTQGAAPDLELLDASILTVCRESTVRAGGRVIEDDGLTRLGRPAVAWGARNGGSTVHYVPRTHQNDR